MTAQRRIPRRHPIRRIVYLCLILICVAAVGWYILARVQWSRRVDRQIKAIAAAGLPVTLEELNRWYWLPEGATDNAADYYLDAFASYVEPNEEDANKVPLAGTGELPGRTEPLPDQTKEAMARFVRGNKQALDLLHEAETIPACRYPVDFTAGIGRVLLPWLSEMRKAVFLLSCDAILHAEQRQPALACRSIQSALCLSRSLLAEPIVFSQLVRMAIQSETLSALERVLSRAELPYEQIIAIDLDLTRGEDPNALRRALVGQRLLDSEVFEHPPPGLFPRSDDESIPGPIMLGIYQGLGLSIRDEADYLDVMAASNKGLDLPEPLRLPAIRNIATLWQQIPPGHILFRRMRHDIVSYCETELRSLSQTWAARTALAIERYRLKMGSLPVDLSDLVPEYLATIPLDPFTGQTLKYRHLSKGYVVYSVSKDLSDDGGRERPTDRKAGDPEVPYDITFIVER